jgi:hypothetical protein
VCIAVALSAGIILTTIHTQDFKDVRGDAATGRVTFPIAYPSLSRVATALFLIAWSWFTSRTWRLDQISAAVMGVLALFVGVRFVVRTDVRADKVSFYWYNVSPPRRLPCFSPYLMRLWSDLAMFCIYTSCILSFTSSVVTSYFLDLVQAMVFGTRVPMDIEDDSSHSFNLFYSNRNRQFFFAHFQV